MIQIFRFRYLYITPFQVGIVLNFHIEWNGDFILEECQFTICDLQRGPHITKHNNTQKQQAKSRNTDQKTTK